jgi:two-component system KDP operon response regulator KdpE
MSVRVLVVDDDPIVAEVVFDYLRHAGMEPRHATDGPAALVLAEEWRPDLVVLDLMLPGIDGLEVCRRLRKAWDGRGPLPVVMLTALGEENDRILGLETGADDYVTKPFSIQELLARVRAHLRRAPERMVDVPIEIGDFVIDAGAHTVTVGGNGLHLTPTEFDLLLYMARNAGKALTHRALLTAVWGGQSAHQPEYLRVFIGQLRRKLEAEAPRQYIQTEPWVGYRFLPEGVPE